MALVSTSIFNELIEFVRFDLLTVVKFDKSPSTDVALVISSLKLPSISESLATALATSLSNSNSNSASLATDLLISVVTTPVNAVVAAFALSTSEFKAPTKFVLIDVVN